MNKHERKAIKSEIATIKRNMSAQTKLAAKELAKHRKIVHSTITRSERIAASLKKAQQRADARIATLTARLGTN